MKYVLLIVDDPKVTQVPESEMGKIVATFVQIRESLQSQGKLLHGTRLRPPVEAKTVRLARGPKPVMADGPFTGSMEAVGGYFEIDVASQAEALEWAKKFPPYFSVEVRAVWEQ
jgi:hypothetical protein